MSIDHLPPAPPTGTDGTSGATSATTWYGMASTPVPPGNQPSSAPTPGESAGPGRGRRLTELAVVASLAAALASGGTYAAIRAESSTTSSPSATSVSSGSDRGTGDGPGTSTSGTSNATVPVVQADPQSPNWTATATAVSPSVVAITATGPSGEGQGSGVVLDTQGHILTNNHVVDGAQTLTVTLNDGTTHPATVKGTDPSTDLAVLTLTKPPAGLKPMAIGDSSALSVGDGVMAIGNPLGLAGTVTTGIVSAVNRPVRTSAADSGARAGQAAEPVVTNAIQTSAAINPGNSGGALVNAAGQLVGINSAIASLGSSGSGQSGNIGIGFAIPSNQAQTIADQLIKTGSASHAYLGVTPVDGEAQLSDGATRAGAQIRQVGTATPAAAAGLRVGDVVVAVDGRSVESADALVGAIRASTIGSKVTLTIVREGQSQELTSTLAARPASN